MGHEESFVSQLFWIQNFSTFLQDVHGCAVQFGPSFDSVGPKFKFMMLPYLIIRGHTQRFILSIKLCQCKGGD